MLSFRWFKYCTLAGHDAPVLRENEMDKSKTGEISRISQVLWLGPGYGVGNFKTNGSRLFKVIGVEGPTWKKSKSA